MDKKQLYYEDVQEGMEITPLNKIATTRTLVKYAGAVCDFIPLHYEDDFAKSQRIKAPIVHGSLKCAWLGHLLMDWIGEEGVLKKYSYQYRGMDFPRKMKTFSKPQDGETWQCGGEVIKKYVQGDENLVECKIWVKNGKGGITVPGTATVALPSRNE